MQNKEGLFGKFKELEERFQSLEEQMSRAEVVSNAAAYQKIAKERASLLGRIEKFREYRKVSEEIERLNKVVREAGEEKDFLELVAEELQILRQKHDALLLKLEEYFLEPDRDEDRNIIVEIRAGTGGEEAALFVADLYRMYTHYADSCGFRVEMINSNPTPLGGFKEIIFSVSGDKVYKKFKFESGVHRVQRVPSTEASGRIHTSAVSVAVLPEAEEMDVEINPSDLKIDVFRAAGAGGQHVNTTDSAVRLTHLPTGVVVTCQDERSQIKNRAKALKVLRARLLDHARRQQESKISRERKIQIGTGDRSEKIRTYNFPDRRVTDHRIGLTLYRIEQILEGDIEEIVLSLHEAQKQLNLKGNKQV